MKTKKDNKHTSSKSTKKTIKSINKLNTAKTTRNAKEMTGPDYWKKQKVICDHKNKDESFTLGNYKIIIDPGWCKDGQELYKRKCKGCKCKFVPNKEKMDKEYRPGIQNEVCLLSFFVFMFICFFCLCFLGLVLPLTISSVYIRHIVDIFVSFVLKW